MSGKYTVISLFAGAGGSLLGYKLAGFKELLAIEWNSICINTLKLNYSNLNIWKKDIRNVKGKDILKYLNIDIGELDILDGSPPCQGFSLAGKRKIDDKRNDLVRENIRLINEIQPKVFIIENVKGMIVGKMKILFKQYLKELKQLNYNVEVALLNAKYYNVPQSRERLIFMGVRKDLNLKPIFPKPSNNIIIVLEALKDVNNKTYGPELTKLYKYYWNKTKPGKALGKFLTYKKINPLKVSPTIVKGNPLYHWSKCRYLTIEEAKRLQTFPDDYKFYGNYKQQWEQIGNSVPPLLMKAIAECIKTNILDKYYAKTA